MLRYISLMLIVLLAACAPFSKGQVDSDVAAKAEALRAITKNKTVRVIQGPFVGATPVKLGNNLPPVFDIRITLRGCGTLEELASSMARIANIRIQVDSGWKKTEEELLVKRIKMRYSGSLRGALDTLSSLSGMGWEYIPDNGEILLSKIQTRTFTLLTAPGHVRYESSITNKSAGQNAGQVGKNQTVTSSEATHQTAQSSKTVFASDAWAEAEAGLQMLLSTAGKVMANRSAGTVTVSDTPSVLRRVAQYVKQINSKLARQVALGVKVWAIEVSDDTDIGLNLQAAFQDSNLEISTVSGNPYTSLTGGGLLSAAILNKRFAGSKGVLSALKRIGKTTLVTSGTGITMNNQPMPIQVMDRQSYLASITQSTDDYGKNTALTPGEVSTAFSMTVVPHILDGRKLILQYNISLSSLNKLEEYSSGDSSIQLPQISTRSFAQRVRLKMGQTLVLAGFEEETQLRSRGVGALSFGNSKQISKTVLVITIDVESLGD